MQRTGASIKTLRAAGLFLPREQIKAKGDNLDQGLIADSSVKRVNGNGDPAEVAEDAIGKLEEGVGLLHQVVKELRQTEVGA